MARGSNERRYGGLCAHPVSEGEKTAGHGRKRRVISFFLSALLRASAMPSYERDG